MAEEKSETSNSNQTWPPPITYPSQKHYWLSRVINPTVAAGLAGRLFFGSFVPAAKAASYFGIRESVMNIRGSVPGDLIDSAIAGTIVGALLSNLKGFGLGTEGYPYRGSRRGAALFTTGCAILTTTNDYVQLKLISYKQTRNTEKDEAAEANRPQSS